MAKFVRVGNIWLNPEKVRFVRVIFEGQYDGYAVLSEDFRFKSGFTKEEAIQYAEQLVAKIEEALRDEN